MGVIGKANQGWIEDKNPLLVRIAPMSSEPFLYISVIPIFDPGGLLFVKNLRAVSWSIGISRPFLFLSFNPPPLNPTLNLTLVRMEPDRRITLTFGRQRSDEVSFESRTPAETKPEYSPSPGV